MPGGHELRAKATPADLISVVLTQDYEDMYRHGTPEVKDIFW